MSDKAIKATTQEHLDIYTIKDHMIVLKDGSSAIILQISAINFGLLSEEEQDAIIFSYAGLLNSLSFPIQILIRSFKKDITSYLELLDNRLQETASQKLKEQIIKYRSFVRSLVKTNNVLEKKFYVVIPYNYLGVSQFGSNLNPLAKSPQKPSQETDYILARAKQELYPRRDHLIRQFARLGLQVKQLTTQEIVTLFYRTYNPSAEGVEQYITLPADYETPVVQSTSSLQPITPPTRLATPVASVAPTSTTPQPAPLPTPNATTPLTTQPGTPQPVTPITASFPVPQTTPAPPVSSY